MKHLWFWLPVAIVIALSLADQATGNRFALLAITGER